MIDLSTVIMLVLTQANESGANQHIGLLLRVHQDANKGSYQALDCMRNMKAVKLSDEE